jgi:hypothetical protein
VANAACLDRRDVCLAAHYDHWRTVAARYPLARQQQLVAHMRQSALRSGRFQMLALACRWSQELQQVGVGH